MSLSLRVNLNKIFYLYLTYWTLFKRFSTFDTSGIMFAWNKHAISFRVKTDTALIIAPTTLVLRFILIAHKGGSTPNFKHHFISNQMAS